MRLLQAAVADPDRALGGLDDPGRGRARHHPAAAGTTPRMPWRIPWRMIWRIRAARRWRAAARPRPQRCRRCLPRRPRARRTPSAVIFEDRVLSYAALEAHANRLAHHLQSLGVGPETAGRAAGRALARDGGGAAGILKAGGAYLPLDPDYPRERLAFMLADAGAPVLVTQRRCSTGCPAWPCGAAARRLRMVRLDADWPAIARQPDTAPPLDLDPAPPRLRDLHLGLDRNAEGRRGEPRRLEQLPRLDGGAGAADAGRPAARRHHHRLRHRGARALPAAARRRLDRADVARDRAGCAGSGDRRSATSRATVDAGDADAVADPHGRWRRAACRISKALPC